MRDLLATSTAAGVMSLFSLDAAGFLHHTGEHESQPGTWSTCLQLNYNLAFSSFVGGSPFRRRGRGHGPFDDGRGLPRVEEGGQGWHFNPVEAVSTSALEEVAAYNVQMTVYDANDVIVANAPLSVRCEDDISLEVNGQSTFFGEGSSWSGTTNAAGQVIVSVPTRSLGVPGFRSPPTRAKWSSTPGSRARLPCHHRRPQAARRSGGGRRRHDRAVALCANQSQATVDALVKGITAASQVTAASTRSSASPVGFFHRLNDARVASFLGAPGATLPPPPTRPPGQAPSTSWRFDFAPGAPAFTVLGPAERAAVAAEHATLPRLELFLGFNLSWGDVFDAITSGVASLVSAVADVVGSVVDAALTLVIDGVKYVYNAVVNAVEQALDLIEEMFKTVVDSFDQLYRWIGFIFNWGDIQRSKDAIKYLANQSIDYGIDVVGYLKTVVDRGFVTFKNDLHQTFSGFAAPSVARR